MTERTIKQTSFTIIVFTIFIMFFIGVENYAHCETNSSHYWISLKKNTHNFPLTQIYPLKITPTDFELRLDIERIHVSEFIEKHLLFQKVTLPGEGHISQVGNHMLPTITRMVTIPASCTRNEIKIEVLSTEKGDSHSTHAFIHVGIKIYNILGQKVKTLVNEQQTAGNYIVRWDGTNDRGNQIASGVYIYQIQSGEFIGTKKMLLLR